MEKLKFDFKKCLNWIKNIEDDFSFSADVGNFKNIDNEIHNLLEGVNLKEHLLKTLIGFKDFSNNNAESDLLNLLDNYDRHWRGEQRRVISFINNSFEYLNDNEKEEKAELKDKYLRFFHYNYDLLKMIKDDILNSYQYEIIEKKAERKKQPSAKVIMEFAKLIDDKLRIYPQKSEYENNNEKFKFIAEQIKKHFDYEYKSGTLENNDMKIEGYSKEVYDLLLEWQYKTEATKYLAKHNIRY